MNGNSVRRGVAAIAAVSAAGGVAVLGASAASATVKTAGLHQCNATQLSTTPVNQDPGAGNRFADLQFTARPGQSCELYGALSFTLAGAPNVFVDLDATGETAVILTPGQSAIENLHWTSVNAPDQQVTPTSITIQTFGTAGDTITLPWTEGPLDDSVTVNTITGSAIQAGTAPTDDE